MKARSTTQQAPSPSARSPQLAAPERAIGGLQSALGNRLTLALMGPGAIQTKLRLGGRNDPLEREADRAADAALGASPPKSRRKLPAGVEGKETHITPVSGAAPAPQAVEQPPEEEAQARTGGGEEPQQEEPQQEQPTTQPPIREEPIQAMVHAGASPAAATAPPPLTGGSPLPGATRSFFEPRFGAELGGVRVHTNGDAAAGARSLGARAYTRGTHLAFDRGEYAPDTRRGKRLLAHELAHVVQQSAAPPLPSAKETAPAPDLRRPSDVRDQLGDGKPLSAGVRARMERGLGRSFADVRLHTDSDAGRLAGRFRAAAFAVGRHVAFAPGRYRPGTLRGDALLAHELAHTMQQGDAADEATQSASSRNGEAGLERDADVAAADAAAALWAPGGGRPSRRSRLRRRSGLRLSRCGEEKETANVGAHTKVNFLLKKPSPKRSDTDPSTVDVKDQSFKASVVDDTAGKQWKYRLASVDSKGEMQIVYFTRDHYPAPKPTDDSGPLSNVTEANWKAIVDDLERNKEGVPDFWSAYRAEPLHEYYHWRNEWQVDAKRELATAEADIDKLSVSRADAADASAAEGKLKGPATTAFNDAIARAQAAFDARGDSPGDPAYKAQAPALQALANRVKAHAAAKKWT